MKIPYGIDERQLRKAEKLYNPSDRKYGENQAGYLSFSNFRDLWDRIPQNAKYLVAMVVALFWGLSLVCKSNSDISNNLYSRALQAQKLCNEGRQDKASELVSKLQADIKATEDNAVRHNDFSPNLSDVRALIGKIPCR